MAKRKAPRIPPGLTLDEKLKLQAADLTKDEGKRLFRYQKNARVLYGSIRQTVKDMQWKKAEPPELLLYFRRSAGRLLRQTKSALEIYCDRQLPTRWMRAVGVGIEQAVGIYSILDIEKMPTPSSLWRFAGYDPSVAKLTKKEAGECIRYFREQFPDVEYPGLEVLHFAAKELNRHPRFLLRITRLGGAKTSITWSALYRAILSTPWNPELKELLYRVGIQFRRVGGRGLEIPPYRSIYEWRKEYEVANNEAGKYAKQAEYKLASRNYRKTTIAYASYIEGKLPAAHLDARARRFAVKIFLVHLHQVMYYERYHTMPPRPYVLDVLEKEHEIQCPKWPFRGGQ